MLLLRLVLGTALALAAFEPIARFFYKYPTVSDPDLGQIPAPGETLRWCLEGCGESHWQPRGLRRATPPDPARPALLAVGDSFTEALQVDDDETFAARLEQKLGVAVLNVGKSAFAPADYLGLAPVLVETWRPRWTIITLKEGDFTGVERGLYRFLRDGGSLRAVAAPRRPKGTLSKIFGRSAMFAFALYRVNQLKSGFAAEPPIFRTASPAPPPAAPRPVASAAEILAALSEAYAGRVTFVLLPRGSQPSEAERAFDAACAGRSCVNLRRRFDALGAAHHPPYGFANSRPGEGHLNLDGHEAVAAALAEELAGRDLQ